MKLTMGIIIGVVATYAATAYGNGSATGVPSCVKWGTKGQPANYTCVVPVPPSAATSYDVQVPSLDLDCSIQLANKIVSESFACERQSRPLTCQGGVWGSLQTYTSAFSIEVDTPGKCVPANNANGYKLTDYGRHYTFKRAP